LKEKTESISLLIELEREFCKKLLVIKKHASKRLATFKPTQDWTAMQERSC